MHGAWLFDLLLLVATAVVAGLAVRQVLGENEHNDEL
jgi:hypothetical protein